MHELIPAIAAVFLGLVTIGDALAIGVPAFRAATSWGFLGISAFVTVYVVYVLILAGRAVIRNHGAWVAVAAFAVLCSVTGAAIIIPHGLSGETAQEVTCGVNALSGPWDGWADTCFLGYPLRQYVLMAMPTHVFGPSLVALGIGTAVAFLGSLGVFMVGMALMGRGIFGIAASIWAVGLLFHMRFVPTALFSFEQSIIPLSIGLLSTGAYLLFVRTKRPLHLVAAGYALWISVQSYTPALTLLPLALMVSWDMWAKADREKRGYLLMLVLFLTIEFGSAMMYRRDVNIGFQGVSGTVGRDIWEGIRYLTVAPARFPYGDMLMKLALFGALVLYGLSGMRGMTFAGWIVAVLIVSVITKGYTWYSVDFRLHRSMVTLPIIAASVLLLRHRIRGVWQEFLVLVAAVAVFATGIGFSFVRFMDAPGNGHYVFMEALRRILDSNSMTTADLGIADYHEKFIVSSANEIRYFLPKVEVQNERSIFPNATCIPVGVSVLAIHPEHPCHEIVRGLPVDARYIVPISGADYQIVVMR